MSDSTKPPGIFSLFKKALGQMNEQAADKKLPYRRKPHLLSEAERVFYGSLRQAAGDSFLIFAKLRLADICYIPAGASRPRVHQQRLLVEQVDFALYDPKSLEPRFLIELEDSTVAKSQREKQAAFLDDVARVIGLPLLQFRVQREYDASELRQTLKEAHKAAQAVRTSAPR